jgi:1,3-beta-glucanosyltransferase GAS1
MTFELFSKMVLIIQGSHFFHNTSGSQFLVRGAFYSDSGRTTGITSSFIDVLADDSFCSRDVPYFQRLGINTLIILDVDTTAVHTSCMQKLRDAGIYVLIQLNGRVRKAYTYNGIPYVTWDYRFYDHFRNVIDGFQQYPNTLGFFLGSSRASSLWMPLAKTAVIYLKDYISQKGYRSIPVGFMHQVISRTFRRALKD